MSENTYIWFPQNMIRITETAREEIGGILLFRKGTVDGKKILRLERTEFVAGDVGMAQPGKVLSSHLGDNQWVLFHTHPKRDIPQYMGLSGGDLTFILTYALTAAGDEPKVSHILLTETFVHYTILVDGPYKLLRDLFRNYRTHRLSNSISDEVILGEFQAGMHSLFETAERFVRKFGGETNDEAAMSILDAIWFQPDDLLTAYMMRDSLIPGQNYPTPSAEGRTFLEWFRSQIPASVTNRPTLEADAKKDVEDLRRGDMTKAGLFYSWSLATNEFRKTGVLATNDGGSLYDAFVQSDPIPYDYKTDILNSIKADPVGGATPTLRTLKGGGVVTVSEDDLLSIARLAQTDMEADQTADIGLHDEAPSATVPTVPQTTPFPTVALPNLLPSTTVPAPMLTNQAGTGKKRRTFRNRKAKKNAKTRAVTFKY